MNNDKYIVLLHNMQAGSGSLLGEFNSNDEYNIADEIKQELIKSNKIIKSYKKDEVLSVATVGSYSFDFVTYVQLGENNKKRISLFLIENVSLNEGTKELKTFLKSVVVDVLENNLTVVKREFNMYIRDESTGIDILNSGLKLIIDRKEKVESRSKFLKTELSNANKEYVLKMLKLIKSSGPYGNQFLNEFRNLIKLKGFSKSQNNYWMNLKNVLDDLIIKNALVFNDKTLHKMKELQDAFIQEVLNVKEPKPVEQKAAEGSSKKKSSKPNSKKKEKPKENKPPKKEQKSSSPQKTGGSVSSSMTHTSTAEKIKSVKPINSNQKRNESNAQKGNNLLGVTGQVFQKGKTADNGRSL